MRNPKTSPLSLQPKQWKNPRSALTWKEGAVSLWNGQSPVNRPVPAGRSATASPMTSTMSFESRT